MDALPEAIKPSAETWEGFWAFVESCQWQKAYGLSPGPVCDAWEWRVIARRGGKGIRSRGVIDAPGNWAEFVTLVRELVGGRPFC